MNFFSEMLAREHQGIGNVWAYLFYGIMTSLTFVVFGVIYMTKGVEFFDGRHSEFEDSVLRKMAWYWLWAFVQQSIVFTILYFIPFGDEWLYLIGVILFSTVFHVPNLKLMGFTFCFSALMYYGYFFTGFTSLAMLSLAHAWGGTLYYKLGWDMRVWRFK